MKIAILTGTVRPNRVSPAVAEWVRSIAAEREGVEFEVVDIADFNLPLYDEPLPAAYGQYANEHTKTWAAKVAEYDGYIFVTGEYNHAVPAPLLNAIAFPYTEWNNKAVGFVGYGSLGGGRAVESLRRGAAVVQMADVRQAAYLSLFDDFENFSVVAPREMQVEAVNGMLDQLLSWAGALKAVRA